MKWQLSFAIREPQKLDWIERIPYSVYNGKSWYLLLKTVLLSVRNPQTFSAVSGLPLSITRTLVAEPYPLKEVRE